MKASSARAQPCRPFAGACDIVQITAGAYCSTYYTRPDKLLAGLGVKMTSICHCKTPFTGQRLLQHRSNQFAAPSMRLAGKQMGCRASRRTALVTSARQQMLVRGKLSAPVCVRNTVYLAGWQCSCKLQVHVPPHPLIKHWLAVARSKDNPPAVFRSAIAELGRILIYEAIRDWVKTVDIPVETPLAKADATIIDPARSCEGKWHI